MQIKDLRERSNLRRLADKRACRLVLLDYLRRTLALRAATRRSESLFLRPKKNAAYPNGYAAFLAEKERFEFSNTIFTV
jgi:hypothetical protein